MELSNDEKQRFKEVYEVLKKDILEDPAVELDEDCRKRVEQMLDYNVPQGKKYRGLFLVETYKVLSEGKQISEDDFFRACVLGWIIQWGFAGALVVDDVMDNSHMRRGKTCWFRLPEVGLMAINDGVLLWSQASRMLKKYFKDEPYYIDLIELIEEICHQSTYGQMIDLISPLDIVGEKGVLKYTSALRRRICLYKTAYGGFYGSFSCALLISGKHPDDFAEEKKILLDMGVYFQSQDDFLDCYGDPKVCGKIGTDIEESKCTWFIVKALELCNEEQTELLCDNYMKANNSSSAAIVKSIYEDLNLREIYTEYEVHEHEKLVARIEALPSRHTQHILKSWMNKSLKRMG